jgi:hypothetical protein
MCASVAANFSGLSVVVSFVAPSPMVAGLHISNTARNGAPLRDLQLFTVLHTASHPAYSVQGQLLDHDLAYLWYLRVSTLIAV